MLTVRGTASFNRLSLWLQCKQCGGGFDVSGTGRGDDGR